MITCAACIATSAVTAATGELSDGAMAAHLSEYCLHDHSGHLFRLGLHQ